VPTLTAIVPATNEPPTLAACLDAIAAAEESPEQVVVVTEGGGPADARNRGAADATGGVLVFVDADVLPHADAFARIRLAFEDDPGLTALFGSYDDEPAADGAVSAFRNLLHHHVHQSAPGPATTFWAGLGAVRREAFEAAGGFDAQRYPLPSVEDIELGGRLVDAGGSIVLDPLVQGTHLKAWSLCSMVKTDFSRRGVPWMELLLERGSAGTALNLGWRHRASALAAVLAAFALIRGRPGRAVAWLGALGALNAPFYRLLAEKRGPAEAALGVGLHGIHHVTGATAAAVALARHLRDR
jgi:GT2 family glycosyltransferase